MKYFFGFLISIGLIVLLIFMVFRGGDEQKPRTTKELASYATTDAQVSMVIDGPVIADQIHDRIKITVDSTSVKYEQFRGYGSEVVKQQVTPNTTEAYTNFLLALGHSGFTLGNTNSKLGDERGFCPLGARYVFELNQSGDQLERYWATSCGKPRTYNGNLNLTITLFQRQVPNYIELVSLLRLLA